MRSFSQHETDIPNILTCTITTCRYFRSTVWKASHFSDEYFCDCVFVCLLSWLFPFSLWFLVENNLSPPSSNHNTPFFLQVNEWPHQSHSLMCRHGKSVIYYNMPRLNQGWPSFTDLRDTSLVLQGHTRSYKAPHSTLLIISASILLWIIIFIQTKTLIMYISHND